MDALLRWYEVWHGACDITSHQKDADGIGADGVAATKSILMGKMMTAQERQTHMADLQQDHERLFEMLSAICASVMTEERIPDLLCAVALAREFFVKLNNREDQAMTRLGYPNTRFAIDDNLRLEDLFDQILADMTMLDRRSIYNRINILSCEMSGHVRKYTNDCADFAMDMRIDPTFGLMSLADR